LNSKIRTQIQHETKAFRFFSNGISRITTIVGGSSSWRIFTYKELHAATNGFSEDNKLGEGGFGSVYRGKTSDGLQVINHIISLLCLSQSLLVDSTGKSLVRG
jgi:hypothetical protein